MLSEKEGTRLPRLASLPTGLNPRPSKANPDARSLPITGFGCGDITAALRCAYTNDNTSVITYSAPGAITDGQQLSLKVAWA